MVCGGEVGVSELGLDEVDGVAFCGEFCCVGVSEGVCVYSFLYLGFVGEAG